MIKKWRFMYFCFQSNGEEVSIFAFDIKANSESQVMIYKPFMGWIVLGKYVHVFACCIYIILSYRRTVHFQMAFRFGLLAVCDNMFSSLQNFKSMGLCKKDITPLLTHWSYVFLAITHRNDILHIAQVSMHWFLVLPVMLGIGLKNKIDSRFTLSIN